tara:strand:+ start:393 stop:1223 length:831 start_codon:yes stop_codon:yes gene_type:complete
MKTDEELTYSQNKTKLTIYSVIGRKIAESRKSSRRKLEGISKKLNISIEVLKKIESGEIGTIEKEIPVTGFIRAFAKITNTDIGEELDKLQSDYNTNEKPKNIYKHAPTMNLSKIFLVFLFSFCFLLLVIYFLNTNSDKKLEIGTDKEIVSEAEFFKANIDEGFKQIDLKPVLNKKEIILQNKNFFEIIFLKETRIEVYNDDKTLVRSGLFNNSDRIDFEFKTQINDYFIKHRNLGGFRIFFKDEFFAPFGYSGKYNNGFYLKEKINQMIQKGCNI